jgi:hypothetical protein
LSAQVPRDVADHIRSAAKAAGRSVSEEVRRRLMLGGLALAYREEDLEVRSIDRLANGGTVATVASSGNITQQLGELAAVGVTDAPPLNQLTDDVEQLQRQLLDDANATSPGGRRWRRKKKPAGV